MKRKIRSIMSILVLSFIVLSKTTGAQENVLKWNENTKLSEAFFADNMQIEHMITIYQGQSFLLSDCLIKESKNISFEAWIQKDVSSLSNGMTYQADALSLEEKKISYRNDAPEKVVTAHRTGVGIVTISFMQGEEKVVRHLAVCVVSYQKKEKPYQKCYQMMQGLNNSKITKKNVKKRYQKYYSILQKINKLPQKEKAFEIKTDGKRNQWFLTNQSVFEAEKACFHSYFLKRKKKVTKAVLVSEYEGCALYWNQTLKKQDILSAAFAQGKAYSEKKKKITLSLSFYNKKGKKIATQGVSALLGSKKVFFSPSGKVRIKEVRSICVDGIICTKRETTFTYRKIFVKKESSIYPKKTIPVYQHIIQKKVIGYLKAGKRYQCMEKGKNGWLHIRIGSKKGFVRRKDVNFHKREIVSKQTKIYGYREMCADLNHLQYRYSDILKVSSIGTTADGNRIYCVRLGNAKAGKKIVIQGAMHAREWMNSQLLMQMIEQVSADYCSGKYQEISYQKLLQKTCFYIIPMLNPDGVSISQYGLSGLSHQELKKKVKKIAKGKKKVYRRWKANARGVDLNRNFSIGFAKKTKKKKSSEEYAGKKALSERETQAFYRLIQNIRPKAVINYHETGNLIYYDKSEKLASLMHKITGYQLCCTKDKANGNLGDWLSAKGIDWCTPETCKGEAPVSHSQFAMQSKKNKNVIPALAKLYGFF